MINTHRFLFRCNRLKSRVKSAPGIFQQITDSMIVGIDGVAAYLDEIIVTDKLQWSTSTISKLFLVELSSMGSLCALKNVILRCQRSIISET
ncbi:hypothetical protein V3C99_012276 [Haemonchus contortus]